MKTCLSLALAALALVSGSRALACFNDTECSATCGSMVCSFNAAHPQTCVAAGTDPGWCTGNAGCQCAGATCNTLTHYCSYTTPPDMASLPDLASPPDLTSLPDLTVLNDLSGVDFAGVDFSSPPIPDLSAPPDLAAPDLSSQETPDLSVVPAMRLSPSSSGCDLGGGAQPAGLLLLAISFVLFRRRLGSK